MSTAEDGVSTAKDGVSTAEDGVSTAKDGVWARRGGGEVEECLAVNGRPVVRREE